MVLLGQVEHQRLITNGVLFRGAGLQVLSCMWLLHFQA
jgi:hypothetical protein